MMSRINNRRSSPPRAGWFLTRKIYCRLVTFFTEKIKDIGTQPKRWLGWCMST